MNEEMNNEVNREPNEESKAEQVQVTKKFTGKQIGIAGGILIVLIALIVGISIYNTPANRLTRLLDLGYRYLEEGNYEQAALTFDKVIAIDDKCMEAYAGGIKSYQGLGDVEGLVDIYERALTVTIGLEEGELAESMETIVEIYLVTDDVYSDNPEKVVQVLEDGLKLTKDDRIENRLIEDYLDLASDYVDQDNYEKALEIYDRLLKLDAENETIQSDLGNCLQEYLDLLMGQGRFDEIKGLIEKYKDKVSNVDFQAILEKIELQEELDLLLEEERYDEAKTLIKEQLNETNDADLQKTLDIIEEQIVLENAAWVDDLFQKMITGDSEAVFAIMSESNFIEKCNEYEHKEVTWSMDYRLLTSDGKMVGVVNSIEEGYDWISVSYCIHGWDWPQDVGEGDYYYSIERGERTWLIGNLYQGSDGSVHELPEGAIFMVYHM